MSTCVVTGGAGFIGSHLCEYLLAEGQRVICVDNLETSTLENLELVPGRASYFVRLWTPVAMGASRLRGNVRFRPVASDGSP